MIEAAIIDEGWTIAADLNIATGRNIATDLNVATDWEALSHRAIAKAVARTPYGGLAGSDTPVEIVIRLTTDAEVQQLNRLYREKDKPTNVLSFPMYAPEDIGDLEAGRLPEIMRPEIMPPEIMLGDIVLARETCVREAAEKGIPAATHATHLIVHGVLHLLGYDHIDDDDANEMEALERLIMADLGHDDPYGD